MPRHRKGRVPFQGSAEPTSGRCASKLRNSIKKWGHWRYCKQPPMIGRTRCKDHGGPSLRGPESGTYKNGDHSRWAKGMPAALSKTYHEERSAEDLLSLEKDIRLMEALQVHELEAMKVVDIGRLIKEGKAAVETIRDGISTPDIGKIRTGADELVELFESKLQGSADAALRLRDMSQEKRKLVEAQRRLYEFKYVAMTAEQVMTIVRRLGDVVLEEVRDQAAVARVQERFLTICGALDQGRTG